MNIFYVMSWYPDSPESIAGIFSKEQVHALARKYPEHNFGVYFWGNDDKSLQLWIRNPLENVFKIIRFFSRKPSKNQVKPNLTEYFFPALTWSQKIIYGNIFTQTQNAHKALVLFENQYGKPSLIHAHVGYKGGYIAMKLAKKHQLKYLITEHMGPFPFYNLIKNGNLFPRLMEAYQNSSLNIAVSAYLENEMKKFQIPNTTVIPNLIDENFFVPHTETNANQHFTFFSLSRLVKGKGFECLLLAFKLVVEKHPKTILKIGGDGELKSTLISLSQSYNLANHVIWLGNIDREEVRVNMQNCDAFVLASEYETMGIAYVEALACGKPIVATKCGGPESTVNTQNGFLAEVNQPKDIADKMILMIENYHLFDKDEIRNDFLKRFSSHVICEKLMQAYV